MSHAAAVRDRSYDECPALGGDGLSGCMNPAWTSPIALYITQMRAVNRAPGTIRLHQQYLHALAAAHPDPWAVTGHDLVALLARPSWGPEAKRSARSVWRGFYRWAHGNGLCETWTGEQLPPISMPRRLPRPAPASVVLRSTNDPRSRIAFMAQLAAYCALRAGEIARVHSDDYDRVNGDLLVHGKGSKQRLVPVEHAVLVQNLERVQGWAFPSTDESRPLTAGHVTRLLSDALPDGWTAHNLRHRFATEAHENGADILDIAEVLGHASLATTRLYTRVSTTRLRATVRAAL